MFTPPPSPSPPRLARYQSSSTRNADEQSSRSLSPSPSPPSTASGSCSSSMMLVPPSQNAGYDLTQEFTRSVEAKRRTARRTKWTILLIPAVLIFITVSTRYLSHPAALDAFSANQGTHGWNAWVSTLSDWQPHKRHPEPDPQQSAAITFPTPSSTSQSSTASSLPSSTSGASQTIPTVPSSPPVLPTPFPQPLDTTFSQNFSTLNCQTFFQNMTQSSAFRDCRPFSLLQQSSGFLEAQNNLTTLNAMIWGTCNTDPSADQCVSNMAWFGANLNSQCSQELSDQNAMVVSTLDGIEAYSLMRNVGCLADQSTNIYCYLSAVQNSNPSDLYFYQLPLGISLPSSSNPSCSACTKSVMTLYDKSLNVSALATTYGPAADIANGKCGTGYVQTTVVGAGLRLHASWGGCLALALSVVGALIGLY